MKNHRDFIIGLLAGAVIVLSLILTTGAIQMETSNTVGNETASFRDLACSADGRTVYALDVENVYRSSDGGQTWSVVLTKKGGASY